MNRVKRFFKTVKAVLALVNKLLPLVGDIMECIKMVDTLVDAFIERRKQGDLKGVSFVDYAMDIIHLIAEIAPLGYSFVETVELLIDYAHKFGTNLKENGGSLGN